MPLRTKWSPFNLQTIKAMKQGISGVYEVGKATGDEVRYIGKSERCIRSRLRTHKGETLFRGCTHFRISRTNSDDAQRTEKKLQKTFIRKYGILPPINKILSPGDPYEAIWG
ncbi:MAG: hypothetical protein HY668_00320 [Chloroflexi bacterium]|nr:hypothetical protein [Chloroflexota bacterium]